MVSNPVLNDNVGVGCIFMPGYVCEKNIILLIVFVQNNLNTTDIYLLIFCHYGSLLALNQFFQLSHHLIFLFQHPFIQRNLFFM